MKKICSFALVALLTTAAAATAADFGRTGPAPRTPQKVDRANPKVPVVVDGIWYTPEEVRSQFQGQDLIYFVDQEAIDKGFVWAFTTAEAAEAHLALGATDNQPQLEKTCADARFNKVPGGTGIDWLYMVCGQTTGFVGSSWDNVISYVEASGSYTILYSGSYFGGDKFPIAGGVTYSNLTPYGFNDRTTSIKVCPEGFTLSDCLAY